MQDCDLYVGIIGLRYGFVPPGQTKSITELEFDAASAAGLDCYLFLKDADHIPATQTDSHRGENHGGERIKAFRARLQSGADNMPRPALITDAADLKVKLLRALPPAIVDNAVSPHAPDAPIPPPPADATELQRMLHRHLHEHWPVLSQSAEFCRVAVFDDVPPPLTAAKVFDLAREGEVDHLLVWTPEYFRDTRAAVWHTADAGSRHGIVCGALLRVVLVAACLGFGLCFLSGNDEPANVFRLRHPVAEFGNRGEEGPALTNAELWAAIERKTSIDPGKDFAVGYLRQQIKRLAKLMGTGLVAVAVPEGRFADPGARAVAFSPPDVRPQVLLPAPAMKRNAGLAAAGRE